MDQEFFKRLLATFKVEAEEHLQEMSAGLEKYGKAGDAEARGEVIETVYRAAHSLKGAARAVNLNEVENVCQNLEKVFNALKTDPLELSDDLYERLIETVDTISLFLSTGDKEEQVSIKLDLITLSNDIVEMLQRETGILPGSVSSSTASEEEISVTWQPQRQESGESVSEPEKPLDTQPAAPEPETSGEAFSQETRISEPGEHLTKEQTEPEQPDIPRSAEQEQAGGQQAADKAPPGHLPQKQQLSDTVRVSVSKLDRLLLQSEEVFAAQLANAEAINSLKELRQQFQQWQKKRNSLLQSVRLHSPAAEMGVDGPAADESLEDLHRLLQWQDEFITRFFGNIRSIVTNTQRDSRSLHNLTVQLMEEVKDVLMLPFSHLFDILPRMVREMARDLGKKVDFSISGGEIEIDRKILEEIKDPLIHLIRNSIDHGIESPEQRVQKGKDRTGVISVSVHKGEGNFVELKIEDDGGGIDFAAVKHAALRKKLISQQEADSLDEQAMRMLLFRSQVSTAEAITDISGHGLGMAIVKEKAESIGGMVSIASEPGKGATITMQLPMKLATFRGIVFRSAGRLFVIPTIQVHHVIRFKPSSVKTIENTDTILVDGRPAPLLRFSALLGLQSTYESAPDEFIPAVVITIGEKTYALSIDAIVREQEILIKSFNPLFKRIPFFSGATILGNGKPVPIVYVPDLVAAAEQQDAEAGGYVSRSEEEELARILVVDDSITSRMLLRDILESAGYLVETAVNGEEAFEKVISEPFELVVSDIEMPLMNGFELTEQIRQTENLSGLPVILVTSLSKREDRERGIDAGANAYIVKSSFEQSNLLETVRTLI